MIPTRADKDETVSDFQVISTADLTTKTYCMKLDRNTIRYYADGKNAMKQAIFKILQTERYQYSQIYSNNYGVEFWNLIGTSAVYAVPTIETRIREALTWDDRILDVTDFNFNVAKSIITVEFTAHTIYGDVRIEGVQVGI